MRRRASRAWKTCVRVGTRDLAADDRRYRPPDRLRARAVARATTGRALGLRSSSGRDGRACSVRRARDPRAGRGGRCAPGARPLRALPLRAAGSPSAPTSPAGSPTPARARAARGALRPLRQRGDLLRATPTSTASRSTGTAPGRCGRAGRRAPHDAPARHRGAARRARRPATAVRRAGRGDGDGPRAPVVRRSGPSASTATRSASRSWRRSAAGRVPRRGRLSPPPRRQHLGERGRLAAPPDTATLRQMTIVLPDEGRARPRRRAAGRERASADHRRLEPARRRSLWERARARGRLSDR